MMACDVGIATLRDLGLRSAMSLGNGSSRYEANFFTLLGGGVQADYTYLKVTNNSKP